MAYKYIRLNDQNSRLVMKVVSGFLSHFQSSQHIIHQMKGHVTSTFAQMCSPNDVKLEIVSASDWWIGDQSSLAFKAATKSIESVWEKKPLVVREGGTMPVIRWLQDFFQVPAVHIPLGQSSDAAHLPNERLRALNLQKGIQVLQRFILNLGDLMVNEAKG